MRARSSVLQRLLPGQPRRGAGGHRARQLLPHQAGEGRRPQGRPPRRRAAKQDGGGHDEVAGALGVREIVVVRGETRNAWY